MIPLSIPNLSEIELQAVQESLLSGWVSSAGPAIEIFEQKVADFTGARFAVATVNGTSALHLALLSSGIKEGDMVLVPNLTFIAPVNAILQVGARPVFVDPVVSDWQMDLEMLEDWLENETELKENLRYDLKTGAVVRAVLPVHVLGYSCDMHRLQALCKRYNLILIEDAAEALGSFRGRQHAGTFGKAGCLSFNGNKIVTSGGGGMLLTNDPDVARLARHLSTQARTHHQEYLHDLHGFNYRMPNLNAALGLSQLSRLETFLQKKKEIFQAYCDGFSDLEEVACYVPTASDRPNHWLFTVLAKESRQLESFLESQEIQTRKLWVPMNRQALNGGFRLIGNGKSAFEIYENSLSLPCSTQITEEQLTTVIKAVRRFYSPQSFSHGF